MKINGKAIAISIRIIFLCFFIGVGIFFVLGEFLLPATNLADSDSCQTMEGQWFQVTGEGDRIPVKIPGKCQAERRERVVIETILPSDVVGKSMSMENFGRSTAQRGRGFLERAVRLPMFFWI